MLKNILFISMCFLLSQMLYAKVESKKCLEQLLPEGQKAAVTQYNQAMEEEVAKFEAIADGSLVIGALTEHLDLIEEPLERCLSSIKGIMKNPDSTVDNATLKVRVCFNIDHFLDLVVNSTDVDLDPAWKAAPYMEVTKKQLSDILVLVEQRVQIAYSASSFEQREAVVNCTSVSSMW